MGKKEEITDVISDAAYDDPNFKKGLVLKFAKATLKLTKVDRKNKRVWAEHISLYDFNTGISHYGHDVDTSDPEKVFCKDCQVVIDEPATEEGEVAAINRQREVEVKEEVNQKRKDKKRRFRYELLKQDGTIQHITTQKGRRKKVGEISKLLKANQVGVVPMIYYPQKYAEAALYSDQDVDFDQNVRNPHLQTLQGDPDLGEQDEYYIVGDVLAEIEIF